MPRYQMVPELRTRFQSLDPETLKLPLLLGGLITGVVIASILAILYLA